MLVKEKAIKCHFPCRTSATSLIFQSLNPFVLTAYTQFTPLKFGTWELFLTAHQLLSASVWGKGLGEKWGFLWTGNTVGQGSLMTCQPHWHRPTPSRRLCRLIVPETAVKCNIMLTLRRTACDVMGNKVHYLKPQDGASESNSNCQLHFTCKHCTLESHKLQYIIIGMVHMWKQGPRHLNMLKKSWQNEGRRQTAIVITIAEVTSWVWGDPFVQKHCQLNKNWCEIIQHWKRLSRLL